MKVFFDTNVLIAAFATHGACNELLNHCIARHTIYTSDFVLSELKEKLLKKIKPITPNTRALRSLLFVMPVAAVGLGGNGLVALADRRKNRNSQVLWNCLADEGILE